MGLFQLFNTELPLNNGEEILYKDKDSIIYDQSYGVYHDVKFPYMRRGLGGVFFLTNQRVVFIWNSFFSRRVISINRSDIRDIQAKEGAIWTYLQFTGANNVMQVMVDTKASVEARKEMYNQQAIQIV